MAFILNWLALILAGIFAAIALLFLLGDRLSCAHEALSAPGPEMSQCVLAKC